MHLAVIVPTYNEAYCIERLLLDMVDLLNKTPNLSYELFVFDSASSDDTQARVRKMIKHSHHIHLWAEEKKTGLGSACKKAVQRVLLEHPQLDAILEMDADGSHRPVDIHKLLEAFENQDVVIGSRYLSQESSATLNWPWYRCFISKLGAYWCRVWLSNKYKDWTGGFRLLRVSFIRRVDFSKLKEKGYGCKIEWLWYFYQHHARIKEVPITFVNRAQGLSKMPWHYFIRAALLVLKMRFKRSR